MQNQSILSRTVSWLRFPLIVGVVFIHVQYGRPDESDSIAFPVANMVCKNFVKSGISSVAVPLFFFISGFFYFYKTQNFDIPVYLKKVRSRFRTIAIPFFVWTALMVAYTYSVHLLGVTHSTFWTESHSFFDWVSKIYGTNFHEDEKTAFPMVFQFWFLRDLFVVGLLSPLWHVALKNRIAGTIFLAAIGALWFAWNGMQIPGLSTTAIFFFCAGAFSSIHGRDFVEDFSKGGIPALIAYLPLLVADALTKDFSGNFLIHRASICVSIVAVVFAVSRGIASGKLHESAFLSGATFFVYAGHSEPYTSGLLEKAIAAFYIPDSNVELIAVFFAKAFLQIVLCLLGYAILKKFFPWSLPCLTGGR